MQTPPHPLDTNPQKEIEAFRNALENEKDFQLRRAMERLREGLFDPVAVRLLTAHEDRLKAETDRAFHALDAGEAPHLCVAGAYGQGKSHSLAYIQDRALREGFVTSAVNLDPRELPFHRFREIYRALMANIQFPGTNAPFNVQWKKWVQQETARSENQSRKPEDFLPEDMPPLYRAILAAMAQKNLTLSEKEKSRKKHAGFRPWEFSTLLNRALAGEAVPTPRLKNVFKYRQVSFHKDTALSKGRPEYFIQLTRSLARLFRSMGYRGWVLLFDEGESLVQAGIRLRSKNYRVLHHFLAPQSFESSPFLYPVFAFTEDFFHQVHQEDYTRVTVRGALEDPCFDFDYAREWEHLTVYRLSDLSPREWEELCRKLIILHGRTYRWEPSELPMMREMTHRLQALRNQETRLKLKALVDCLDVGFQEQRLGQQGLEPA